MSTLQNSQDPQVFCGAHPSSRSMKSFDANDLKRLAQPDPGKDNFLLSRPGSRPPEALPGVDDWIALCAKAAVEQDPKKLLDLVIEINRLLDARRKRLLDKDDGTEVK
jgi:hypothetical protein